MRRVLVVLIVLILLAGCSGTADKAEEISYYEMLDLLGMNVVDVVSKEESGNDMHIVYGESKYQITIYNMEKVVCSHGKDKFVMYENGKVEMNYDKMTDIVIEKILVYTRFSKFIEEKMAESDISVMVDFYDDNMVTVELKDGKIDKTYIEVGIYIKEMGRATVKATYDKTGIIDFDVIE